MSRRHRALLLLVGMSLALAAAASGGSPLRAAAMPTAASIPNPPTRQQTNLHCEAVAMQIALAIKGVDVSQDWVEAQFPADLRAAQFAPDGYPVRWGNPYEAFVGDVNGSMGRTGYGVYWPQLVVAARNAGFNAWGGENWNPVDLYAEVAKGNPVEVWAPWSLEPVTVTSMQTWDNQTVWFSRQEHAQTLIGYDYGAGTITLDDPLSGNIRTFPMWLFEQRFAQFQSSAVVVGTSRTSHAAAVRGTDNQLYINRDGGGYIAQGGVLTAPAAIAQHDDGSLISVAVGTDQALWVRDQHNGWNHLSPSATACHGPPAAAVWGNLFVVACRGSDDAMWVGTAMFHPGQLPSVAGFAPYGGHLIAGPAVTIVNGSPLYVVTGNGGVVYQRTDGWGWRATPFTCRDSPALASSWGTVMFACHGTDDALWYGIAASGMPAGARSARGVVAAGVGAAPMGDGWVVDVQGTDGAVWENAIVNGVPWGWHSLGGTAIGGARSA